MNEYTFWPYINLTMIVFINKCAKQLVSHQQTYLYLATFMSNKPGANYHSIIPYTHSHRLSIRWTSIIKISPLALHLLGHVSFMPHAIATFGTLSPHSVEEERTINLPLQSQLKQTFIINGAWSSPHNLRNIGKYLCGWPQRPLEWHGIYGTTDSHGVGSSLPLPRPLNKCLVVSFSGACIVEFY